MDYEKKYKEALEWMQSLYNGLHGKTKEEAERYFPELKSEDEKVRNLLISLVENWKVYNPNSPFADYPIYESNKEICDKILAWLEKQGEKKPQRMISAEAKEAMYDKPAWSEEDEDFMYDTLSNLTELKDRYGEGYGNVGKCIDWLKSLKQRIGG